MSEKIVTEYVDEQWGLGDPDMAIQVEVDNEKDGQACFHGYVLANRRGRDYSVQLVEATGCDSPLPSSGGSVKSPRVNSPSGAKFGLMVPKTFAIRHGLIVEQVVVEPNPLSGFSIEQLQTELNRRIQELA